MSLPVDAALAAWRKALPEREWLAFRTWTDHFYDFQKPWVLDETRFAALLKSRQIGASHSMQGWAVGRAAMLGEPVTIVSLGQREADEELIGCRKHARALEALGSAWAQCDAKASELRFPVSGGRIIALPASSSARGYSGHVVIQELAYHGPQAEAVWDGAAGSVLHGWKMRIASTPNGAAGLFHDLMTSSARNQGWTLWKCSIHDAISAGMRVSLQECWSQARGDRRVFAQLFECDWLNSEEQYLQREIVEPCIQADDDPGANHFELQGRLRYFRGIDVGLVNDLTSIATVAQDTRTHHCWVVDVTCCKRTEWTRQQEIIAAVEEAYPARRWCVDATGLGAVPVQLLQRQFGRHKVVGVPFSTPVKAELASGLYQALADQVLTIPNDRSLCNDLYALRRIVTSAGGVRFDADHDENGHADRAWALALAIHAINEKLSRELVVG